MRAGSAADRWKTGSSCVIRRAAGRTLRLPLMRLVTYDRGGQRRLGAILEGEVVDLPDAVGHPAFPTTLEGFVTSSRGTVMDAAVAALERDDAHACDVSRPRILTPLFPRSLISPGSQNPPGRSHRSLPGSTARRASSTRPASSTSTAEHGAALW